MEIVTAGSSNTGKTHSAGGRAVSCRRNYSRELEKLISGLGGRAPTLLLHACCAPCSSASLEYLSRYFSISLLYYNPNISPIGEYEKRLGELQRLVRELPVENPVSILPCEYRGEDFANMAAGLEGEPEGGMRCMACYRLRLEEAARAASEHGFEYFTTTLTISPLKNAGAINRIGEELSEKYGVKHLPSDLKKRDGYKRSIELSRIYGLYRQDYCGCIYSRLERERIKERRADNLDT